MKCSRNSKYQNEGIELFFSPCCDFEYSSKFIISRFWWLKLTTLAEIGDWIELEKLSRLKKSPIGYEVFCI